MWMKSLVTVATLSISSGCLPPVPDPFFIGSDNDDQSDSIDESPSSNSGINTTNLTGTMWEFCAEKEFVTSDEQVSITGYMLLTFTDESSYTLVMSHDEDHSDGKCSGITESQIWTFNYYRGTNDGDWTNISTINRYISYQYFSQKAVTEANAQGYWGIRDWSINAQRNIVGRKKHTSDGEISREQLKSGSGRFRVDGKKLFFNSGIDGMSSLGELIPYQKIN